ncbi:MAG: hypothetical protein HC902_02055 [Calothrix sp. SM1_5_4]|nr:hypothetical protein [Calothrix sp. SM1_5_4]
MAIVSMVAALLFLANPSWARPAEENPIYGAHYGYTFEVADEKNRRDLEMVLLKQPEEPRRPLNDVIFNPKLSREFQQQYEYRFGQRRRSR